MEQKIAAHSVRAAAPTVHILSPSLDSSQRFRERLSAIFGWEPIEEPVQAETFVLTNNSRRALFPFQSTQWDSIGLQCPRTSTMIHWVSVANSRHDEQKQPHALIGVQAAKNLNDARNALTQSIQSTVSQTSIALRSSLGQPLSPTHFLGASASPVVSFETQNDVPKAEEKEASSTCHEQRNLKEVALPFFIEESKSDELTLLEKLGRAQIRRPRPGLYQFPYPSGLSLRPLPAAWEDRRLSPASLIFHCDSIAEWEESLVTASDIGEKLRVAVVGRTGCDMGQLLLRSIDHVGAGVDIRVCENKSHSPMFAEAQESLLAASLPDLQSSRVLHAERGHEDPKTEKMDCWTEFRANVRNPSGYFKAKGRRRTAKVPDLPYE